jgi:hypothetical protein
MCQKGKRCSERDKAEGLKDRLRLRSRLRLRLRSRLEVGGKRIEARVRSKA